MKRSSLKEPRLEINIAGPAVGALIAQKFAKAAESTTLRPFTFAR